MQFLLGAVVMSAGILIGAVLVLASQKTTDKDN